MSNSWQHTEARRVINNYLSCIKTIQSIATHSKSREKPAQTTEDESFNKANDVEQPPSLNRNAIAGKEYCYRTVDSNRQCKH